MSKFDFATQQAVSSIVAAWAKRNGTNDSRTLVAHTRELLSAIKDNPALAAHAPTIIHLIESNDPHEDIVGIADVFTEIDDAIRYFED